MFLQQEIIEDKQPLGSSRRKNAVLRSLFQLLGVSDSRVLMKVVRVILMVRLTAV